MSVTFIDNGDSSAKADWRCGILSGYSIARGVPSIQQPLIYNNTFVDNNVALSVWEDRDILQIVNSPCFFNNIMYSTDTSTEPAIIRVNNDRNRLIAFHNNMDGYDDFFELNDMKLTSSRDFIDDPGFAETVEYRLETTSACLNEGYFSLSPGATDMSELLDTYYLDTGYHFTDITPVMGPPENLADDGSNLTWDPPDPEPQNLEGYVVYWEDAAGILIDLEFCETCTYSVDESDRDQGYWFGVCGFNDNGQYGETAFIEL